MPSLLNIVELHDDLRKLISNEAKSDEQLRTIINEYDQKQDNEKGYFTLLSLCFNENKLNPSIYERLKKQNLNKLKKFIPYPQIGFLLAYSDDKFASDLNKNTEKHAYIDDNSVEKLINDCFNDFILDHFVENDVKKLLKLIYNDEKVVDQIYCSINNKKDGSLLKDYILPLNVLLITTIITLQSGYLELEKSNHSFHKGYIQLTKPLHELACNFVVKSIGRLDPNEKKLLAESLNLLYQVEQAILNLSEMATSDIPTLRRKLVQISTAISNNTPPKPTLDKSSVFAEVLRMILGLSAIGCELYLMIAITTSSMPLVTVAALIILSTAILLAGVFLAATAAFTLLENAQNHAVNAAWATSKKPYEEFADDISTLVSQIDTVKTYVDKNLTFFTASKPNHSINSREDYIPKPPQ